MTNMSSWRDVMQGGLGRSGTQIYTCKGSRQLPSKARTREGKLRYIKNHLYSGQLRKQAHRYIAPQATESSACRRVTRGCGFLVRMVGK